MFGNIYSQTMENLVTVNRSYIIPNGQSKMDSPEKLATQAHHMKKNTTQYADGHHYPQKKRK